jgi:ADP-ribose pyrophosphatase
MKLPVPAAAGLEIDDQTVPWSGRSTLRLVRFRHLRFDGAWSAPVTWELWQRGRAAAMLPYDPVRDQVVLIEQFRLPAHAAGMDGIMREIPAGLCEPGETPEATIRRELEEEAGVTARRAQWIGDFLLAPGTSDETISIFVGEVRAPEADRANDTDLSHRRDANEDIRVVVVPAAVAIEDALAGKLPNSVATIGLLWLAVRRDWLRTLWQ